MIDIYSKFEDILCKYFTDKIDTPCPYCEAIKELIVVCKEEGIAYLVQLKSNAQIEYERTDIKGTILEHKAHWKGYLDALQECINTLIRERLEEK